MIQALINVNLAILTIFIVVALLKIFKSKGFKLMSVKERLSDCLPIIYITILLTACLIVINKDVVNIMKG